MPLGMEVGLSPGHIVLDGELPRERDTAAPTVAIYGRRLYLCTYNTRPVYIVVKGLDGSICHLVRW